MTGQFDVVYTGIGALVWLPDLENWAAAVFRLLKPDGLFFVRDGHPMLYALNYTRDDEQLVLAFPYFGTECPPPPSALTTVRPTRMPR